MDDGYRESHPSLLEYQIYQHESWKLLNPRLCRGFNNFHRRVLIYLIFQDTRVIFYLSPNIILKSIKGQVHNDIYASFFNIFCFQKIDMLIIIFQFFVFLIFNWNSQIRNVRWSIHWLSFLIIRNRVTFGALTWPMKSCNS